jgi:hypothetical protein
MTPTKPRSESLSHESAFRGFCLLLAWTTVAGTSFAYEVKPLSKDLAKEYKLDASFYKKGTLVQNILIATSADVGDTTHREVAYQFDMVMKSIDPKVAQRVRDRGVLCLLIGHDERTSELPQFATDKTGEELDFYNWRNRGFLTWKDGRPTVVFAEEDVMEFEGGMRLESILLHEFGHVVHGAGFDDAQQRRLTETYKHAVDAGLWNDGRAAQRFRRVKSDSPVSLLDALKTSFPNESPELLKKCLDGGDILVNGEPTNSQIEVTKDDNVLIVFGGPKQCYAGKNRAEYWAEGFQTWYDTNRTMDHDHNHIHTREQLKKYDPKLAEFLQDVLGDPEWRFVSPRRRAGTGHLKEYDPATAPAVVDSPLIKKAANDYYDEYWKEYWQRLYDKYEIDRTDVSSNDGSLTEDHPNFVVVFADDLGYHDLGCYGSPLIRTPNIDRIAKEGVKFTDFYAQTVCGPSRAALMTGCYPLRVAKKANDVSVHPFLHRKEITIAEILKEQGYATGCFGKWDLAGHSQVRYAPELLPTKQGFDNFFGTPSSNDSRVNLLRNEEIVEKDADMATLTKRYTDEAINFISRNQKKPFFVYIPHTMPHTLLAASEEFKGRSKRGMYGDVVEEIDANVGRLLNHIQELGLDESTYVFFISDNGPWWIKKGEWRVGDASSWSKNLYLGRRTARTVRRSSTGACTAGRGLQADGVYDGYLADSCGVSGR